MKTAILAMMARENGKSVFKGFVEYQLPVLSDFGDFPEPDEYREEEIDKDGNKAPTLEPIYNDEKLAFLQKCLKDVIQGKVRGMRTADPSGELPQTLEEYIEGASGPKYMTVVKMAKEGFKEFLDLATQFPESTKEVVVSYLDPRVLAQATDQRKEKFSQLWTDFLTSLGDQAGQLSTLTRKLEEAIQVEIEDF